MALLSAGAPCPAFTLRAAVSGREVSPGAAKGKRLVLVLHGPKTSDAAKEVGKAVRAVHTSADVVVANVVNLKAMGGLWKKVAEAQLKATYEKMAGKVTLGDPADYVVICPDWENAVAPLFGVEDGDRTPGLVVVRADGTVAGVAEGAGLGEKAVAWLATA